MRSAEQHGLTSVPLQPRQRLQREQHLNPNLQPLVGRLTAIFHCAARRGQSWEAGAPLAESLS